MLMLIHCFVVLGKDTGRCPCIWIQNKSHNWLPNTKFKQRLYTLLHLILQKSFGNEISWYGLNEFFEDIPCFKGEPCAQSQVSCILEQGFFFLSKTGSFILISPNLANANYCHNVKNERNKERQHLKKKKKRKKPILQGTPRAVHFIGGRNLSFIKNHFIHRAR